MAPVESLQPLPDELADEFAGKWVVIRARKVIRSADSYDELMEDGELDRGDLLTRIPPAGTVVY
jgi:hypothetical protein